MASRIFSSMALALMLIPGIGCGFVARTGSALTEVSCDTNLRFQGGDGTVGSPYQICAPEHFENLGNTAGVYYKITNDIDLSTVTRIASFSGTLDGNGQTISGYRGASALFGTATNITIQNLTIDGFVLSGSGIQSAMMDSATNATFTNITLRDLTATGTSDFGFLTGTCVSCNAEDIALEDSTATGTDTHGGLFHILSNATRGLFQGITTDNVTITTDGAAGGIAYSATNVEFVDITVNATISAQGGGLIAYTLTDSDVISATTSGVITADSACGGIAGSTSGKVKITQATNSAAIQCSADDAGGMVGVNATGSLLVTRSTNSGSVSCSSNCGGFIGRNVAASTLSHVKSTGSVSGDTYVAGIAGRELGGDGVYLTHAISTATLSGTSEVYGMVDGNGSASILESYFDQTTAGTLIDYGATPKLSAEMIDADTYWSFENERFWNITDGALPTLRARDFVTDHVKCDPNSTRTGTGTALNPYVICDASHLTAGLSGYMKIVRDLSLNSVIPWVSLDGTSLTELDGDHYVLSGLFDAGAASARTGFVGLSNSNARYDSIHIHGAIIQGTTTRSSILVAGPFAGTITDSTTSGFLQNLASVAAGGIVGDMQTGSVTNSKSYLVSTYLGSSPIGGAIGRIIPNGSASVTGVTATIKFTDPNNTVGVNSRVGGLVGSVTATGGNSATITQSSASGSITGHSSETLSYIGGIAGIFSGNSNISVIGTRSSVNILNGMTFIGGFTGYLVGSSIERSSSNGSVEGGANTGGFVGYSEFASINDAYSTGSVTSTSSGSASFIAMGETSTLINRAYASGAVIGPGFGFAGDKVSSTFSNCFFDTTTTTKVLDNGGCTGLTTANMWLNSTYAAWDLINIWNPPGGTAYPTLR